MKNLSFIYVALIIPVLLTSCATTDLQSVWKDENYRGGKIEKVLIIGVSRKPPLRRLYENIFAEELNPLGISGIPSHSVLPEEEKLDKETVVSRVREIEIDAVILTKLVGKRRIASYYPPSGVGWYAHYAASYGYVYNPGYLIEDDYVSLETSLFDAGEEKLIWSALTETYIMGSDEHAVRAFIKIIIDNLSEEGLLN